MEAKLARNLVHSAYRLDIANVTITGMVSNVLGVSGRAILRALIAGQTDPAKLADWLGGR